MTGLERIAGSDLWRRAAALAGRATAAARALAPPSLTQFAPRFGLAIPFWQSGVNKWDGFLQLSDVAVLLFESEFKLHLPGGPYDYPAPGLMAFAAGAAKIALPVLLVLGLATRLAASGLLVMTLVVQLTIPGGWPLHATWAAMASASWPGVPAGCRLIELRAAARRER
jgi:putative oxidoreductase